MRNYAQLFTAIWRDDDFKALNPARQQAYFLLVTQPNISAGGVLPLTVRRWAKLSEGDTTADLRERIEHLDAAAFVVVDEDTEELLVRSFIRHDNGYRNPRRQPSIREAVRAVESPRLRQVLAEELARLGCPASWLEGDASDAPPEDPADDPFPQVNSHSDSHSDAPDGTGGMANESAPARTATPNPQPTTHNPADAAPASPPAAEPTTITPGWLTTHIKPTARPGDTGTQAGLFSTRTVKLTERQQIIYDWSRADYPETTEDDARAVERLVRLDYPGKPVGYIRAIAGPEGSGFGAWYERMRKERGEATERAIREMEKTEPACEHGTLAGRALHPTHHTLICPQCRSGAPARVNDATTHPDVIAALAAYQAASHGLPLPTTTLIALTQQAEALRRAGVPAEQLTALARAAAAAGTGLLTAARKDSAA
ncbi:hypothetical protein OOJ91_12070 [Micromonospora lupini]|uniref:hypothetical protein n=1 Tax=Micromonospora lupini TaxID=285679 RepID=UPI00225AF46A|nr:hypothetical protein [Micromonospora lupini]MCX5066614.1 hypothetical protein [Micromonospora lupini]